MQTIYNGIINLSKAIEGSTKVMIVCDSSYPFLNIKDKIEQVNFPHVIFNQFSSNPLYEDVCKGVDLFQITKCDTILAVGGGSSLDVAKCIKLFCQMSKEDIFLNQEYKDTHVKLIAIPTTAGTGSESTRYAVVYYEGKKQSVTHDSIIPNIAILEPSVLKTLPLYQKKCTMLDALCQSIESWWSVNSNKDSIILSKRAVEIIMHWWHEYIFDNTDESAKNIMYASNLAGQAICITQTTAAHAFSYKITSLYHIPHGHAVAICLPEIWQYMTTHIDNCIDSRGQFYLETIFNDIANSMGCTAVNQAINVYREMLLEMNITSPGSANLLSDISLLSSSVNPIRLRNNPVQLDEMTITNLYNIILG